VSEAGEVESPEKRSTNTPDNEKMGKKKVWSKKGKSRETGSIGRGAENVWCARLDLMGIMKGQESH